MIDAEESQSIAQETNIGPLLFIEHEGNSYLATRPKGEWVRELMAKSICECGRQREPINSLEGIIGYSCDCGEFDNQLPLISPFRALLNLLTLGVGE